MKICENGGSRNMKCTSMCMIQDFKDIKKTLTIYAMMFNYWVKVCPKEWLADVFSLSFGGNKVVPFFVPGACLPGPTFALCYLDKLNKNGG